MTQSCEAVYTAGLGCSDTTSAGHRTGSCHPGAGLHWQYHCPSCQWVLCSGIFHQCHDHAGKNLPQLIICGSFLVLGFYHQQCLFYITIHGSPGHWGGICFAMFLHFTSTVLSTCLFVAVHACSVLSLFMLMLVCFLNSNKQTIVILWLRANKQTGNASLT